VINLNEIMLRHWIINYKGILVIFGMQQFLLDMTRKVQTKNSKANTYPCQFTVLIGSFIRSMRMIYPTCDPPERDIRK